MIIAVTIKEDWPKHNKFPNHQKLQSPTVNIRKVISHQDSGKGVFQHVRRRVPIIFPQKKMGGGVMATTGTYKGCALGNNVNKPFARSDTRSTEVLDLIHSDVCGPMTIKSLSGHQYCVTSIDDFLRKTWLYLLKNKYKVFKKFQEFNNEVENLTERKIKTMRPNNGGEYTSKELIAFCKEVGINRKLITPYNPE